MTDWVGLSRNQLNWKELNINKLIKELKINKQNNPKQTEPKLTRPECVFYFRPPHGHAGYELAAPIVVESHATYGCSIRQLLARRRAKCVEEVPVLLERNTRSAKQQSRPVKDVVKLTPWPITEFIAEKEVETSQWLTTAEEAHAHSRQYLCQQGGWSRCVMTPATMQTTNINSCGTRITPHNL